MSIERNHLRAVAAAAVGLLLLPAAAGARAPRGTTIGTGFDGRVVVDDAQRLISAHGPDAVRVLEPASGSVRDHDLGGGCPATALDRVVGAAGGRVLLRCSEAVPGVSGLRRDEPRLLDLGSGALTVPAGLAAAIDRWPNFASFALAPDGIALYWMGDSKNSSHRATLGRDGQLRQSGAVVAAPCPAGGVRWARPAHDGSRRSAATAAGGSSCIGRSPPASARRASRRLRACWSGG